MSALKRIQHKDWTVVRDLWLGHLPAVDFDQQYPEPTLAQLPQIRHPELNASGLAESAYEAGIREAVFREAVLLARKFIYCASLLPTLSQVGKSTWTVVAAYEAAFYGAKTFIYMLGFVPLDRSSKIFIDVFFETERKRGKQKIKIHETLRFHKLSDRLTHETLWALTQRLLDTTKFDGERREIQTELKIIDWDKFQSFRNSIFYDAGFWPMRETMSQCDIIKPTVNEQICSAAYLDDKHTAPFGGDYFATATLFRRLILSMLENIAMLTPALNPEIEAFKTLNRPLAA